MGETKNTHKILNEIEIETKRIIKDTAEGASLKRIVEIVDNNEINSQILLENIPKKGQEKIKYLNYLESLANMITEDHLIMNDKYSVKSDELETFTTLVEEIAGFFMFRKDFETAANIYYNIGAVTAEYDRGDLALDLLEQAADWYKYLEYYEKAGECYETMSEIEYFDPDDYWEGNVYELARKYYKDAGAHLLEADMIEQLAEESEEEPEKALELYEEAESVYEEYKKETESSIKFWGETEETKGYEDIYKSNMVSVLTEKLKIYIYLEDIPNVEKTRKKISNFLDIKKDIEEIIRIKQREAEAYVFKEKRVQAIRLYEESLQLNQKSSIKIPTHRLLRIMRELAYLYKYLGYSKKALNLLEKTQIIYEDKNELDSLEKNEYEYSLIFQYRIYSSLFLPEELEVVKVIELCEKINRTIDISQKSMSPINLPLFLSRLYRLNGEYEKSLKIFNKVQNSGNSFFRAFHLINKVKLYEAWGKEKEKREVINQILSSSQYRNDFKNVINFIKDSKKSLLRYAKEELKDFSFRISEYISVIEQCESLKILYSHLNKPEKVKKENEEIEFIREKIDRLREERPII